MKYAPEVPVLVILAAGIGRRFGGPKQLEPVGPGGATLMDYAIYDARRAGFGNVVCVIRPGSEAAFRRFDATLALQRLDDVAAGTEIPGARDHPWGTGQAVLAAESVVESPFAVVNADDFYGLAAFAQVAAFLRTVERGAPAVFANVAYSLRATLSPAGGVNRAVCRSTADGWLEAVDEVVGIRRLGDGAYTGLDASGRPVSLAGDALVSMNMWAFTPAVFALLRREFAGFLRGPGAARSEFLISHAIRDAVGRGEVRVRLLRASGCWLGVTFPEDRPGVAAALRDLVAAGEYPERLWA